MYGVYMGALRYPLIPCWQLYVLVNSWSCIDSLNCLLANNPMAESCVTSLSGETVHEGVGTEELDPNFSSSSLYLLGIVNQSQNASFGVEDSMFRPNSPTFRQVLELVYQRSVELVPGDREGPGVWEVVDTVRNCMFQTDEGGVGNEHEVLLHSLSVQLELQVVYSRSVWYHPWFNCVII